MYFVLTMSSSEADCLGLKGLCVTNPDSTSEMDSSPPAAVSQCPSPSTDNLEDVMALFEGDNQGQEYPESELYLLAEEVASSYSPQPSETSSKEGVYICVVYKFVCICVWGVEREEEKVSKGWSAYRPLHFLSTITGANGEGQGEIDEGFDEEFCDMEDISLPKDSDANNLTPSLVMLEELNDKELHLLLADGAFNNSDAVSIPNPALLDDFDLGVDLLDSEQSAHNLLDCEPLKSPVFSYGPPCSPYHVATPSPILVPTSDLQTMSLNDCNALMTDADSGQSCSLQCDDFDMLYSMCEGVGPLTDTPSPHSTTSFYIPPPCPPSPHMQRTTHLLETNLHTELSKFTTPPQTRTQSLSDRYPTPCGGITSLQGGNGHLDSRQVTIKTENEGNSDTCSRGSQTAGSSQPPTHTQTFSISKCTSELGSGASTAHYPSMTSVTSSATCCSSDVKRIQTTEEDGTQEKLVSMPFHQFKQILDSSKVEDKDKEEAKCIRRRGKNKVAAKNCRQRKLEIIFGLQQEIEQLREAKSKLAVKSQDLQQEIAVLRQRCALGEQTRSRR